MAVASIIFYTDDKRVLLQGRKGISKQGEDWSFFGGHIEDAETPEQALVREIKEELDYDLHAFSPLLTLVAKKLDGTPVTVHYFSACVADLRAFTLLEGSEMRLVPLAEAKTYKLMDGQVQALDALETALAQRVPVRRVALIVFFTPRKEILLQDRVGRSRHGAEWGFFGGGIEEGETPEQAVVRETQEELSFALEQPRFLGVVRSPSHPTLEVEAHLFAAPMPAQSLLTQREGNAMRLFSIAEARTLKISPVDGRILDLLEETL